MKQQDKEKARQFLLNLTAELYILTKMKMTLMLSEPEFTELTMQK